MSCTNCSNNSGCKSNGSCSSGGCHSLSVFNWLADVDTMQNQQNDMVEIRFKNNRKWFYRNAKNLSLHVGDLVVVEATPGYDIGIVSIIGELASIQLAKKAPSLKPFDAKIIKKIATKKEIEKWKKGRGLENEMLNKTRIIAVSLKLKMKISDVEYQGDLSKATFYYTAEDRVDFRQLIKRLAEEFKIRVEMRQIGPRQEAAKLGGIGSCGRELCCSSWLTDFKSVSTGSARYQQLSLNTEKLSGQCGRLKCCLNYELDAYLEVVNAMPKFKSKLKTKKGAATHIKTDVFKELMWFSYEGESGLVSLKPDKALKIYNLNKKGVFPDNLNDFEEKKEVVEPVYSNVVGQDSVSRFENKFKKKKKKKKAFFKKRTPNKKNH